MTTSLDDVLSGQDPQPQEPQTAAQQPQGEPAPAAGQNATGDAPAHVEAPADATPAAATSADASATPAQQTGSMVPLKALEEERKGRQDWKEKAIRAEAALEALRTQQPQPQAEQPTHLPPELALLNERMNMSEIMVRNQHQDVDEMLDVFAKEAEKNPGLKAQLVNERHPWQWMYEQAKRIQAMNEIGSDPAAYRQKLRDEILAELQAGQAAQATPAQADAPVAAPAAPVIPKTLATARSAAPRTAAAWTGPTPLADILNLKR